MLLASTLIALASFQPASPSADAAKPVRWPVHIVDGDRHPGGRSPAMVVGSLFTGGHCYREDDGNRVHATPAGQIVMPSRYKANKYSPVMAEYLLGNVRPRPGCDEEETCVFLTSPPLENGWDFTVDSVTLTGNVWEVQASYWHDDIKHQWSPGANRDGQMLRLGWLPAGEYVCRLTLHDRFMSADAKRKGIYELTKVRTGEVKFTVTKSDPWRFHSWDQPQTTAVLKLEDMKETRHEPVPAQQMPFYAAKREDVVPVASGGSKSVEPTVEVRVAPALDWRKHSQSAEALWQKASGEAVTDGVLVAEIRGGEKQTMGRHDWAEITSVEWNAPDAQRDGPGAPPSVTVRATVWRRAFIDGNKPQSTVPCFAVPLETAGLPPVAECAKVIRVNVVWTEGVDNPRGAVYQSGR
ncbi:MAG: hypothetical protein HEQ23_01995 [Tepidisphaera sp.]